MKVTPLLTLLPIAVSGAAVPLDKRQGHGHGGGGQSQADTISQMGGIIASLSGGAMPRMPNLPPSLFSAMGSLAGSFLPSQKALRIEEIPSVLRKDAKRIKLIYGPYKLRAKGGARMGNGLTLDPSGTGYSYATGPDFPKDVTILDAISIVTDEKYNPIDFGDGLYNHHNVFIDLSKPVPPILSCGDGKAFSSIPVNVIMGGAADTFANRYTTSDGQFKSGFYLNKGATVMQMVDIVNYNNVTRDVYTVSEMEYLPGKQDGYLQSTNTGIDLGTCAGKTGMFVHAPQGVKQFTFAGKDFTIERDGYFLNLHGHMHDGGVDIVVKVNNKEICVSSAQYGGPGHEGKRVDGENWTTIRGMSSCEEPIKVVKGDKLSISANFDMEKHPERAQATGGMAEAMALLTVTFATSI